MTKSIMRSGSLNGFISSRNENNWCLRFLIGNQEHMVDA